MTTQKPLMTRRTEASTRTVDLQSDVALRTHGIGIQLRINDQSSLLQVDLA